jgi:hypothetical protein
LRVEHFHNISIPIEVKTKNKILPFRGGSLTKQFQWQYNKVVVDSNQVAAVVSTDLPAVGSINPVVVLTKEASEADSFPVKKPNIVSTILSGYPR